MTIIQKGEPMDLIDRQAAIDAARDWYEGLICGSFKGLEKRLRALPSAQPEPHWIPTSERLPEEHGAYIVCYSDFRHGIYYGRVIAVAWFDLGDTWLKYRYADNARTFPPKLHYVIAWMPLPEPYKEVTK